jgi:RNA polymerase sigma-70 factor (ECF subfamily)
MPDNNSDERGVELEQLRPYLRLIARMHLDYRLRSLFDPDDVVNDIFGKALQKWDQRNPNGSLKGWLRQIVLNHLKDLIDKHKENVNLKVALEHSSVRLDALLDDGQSSPSQRAAGNEELARLAEALALLPIKEQEVIILVRLHEMKLKDVAAHLGLTLGAVAGLLHRGMERLVRHLTFPE